jgi:hypothetical protein
MNFWKSKLDSLNLCPKHNTLMGYKFKPNHEYFNEIDNEYKAYFLGLLYADGCITQPKGNRQMKLHISLQEEDGYILQKFSKEVINREVVIRNPPVVQKMGWKKRATVTIISDKLCKKLISYGCKVNKSRVGMDFPEMEKSLIPHFIRGFLDGDGSIIFKKLNYKYKRKTSNPRKDTHKQQYKLKLAFCSTDKKFLEKVAECLPTNKVYFASRLRKQLVHILWIENTEDVKNCLYYLYKNANYYFKRKHDKIEEFNKTIKSQATSTLVEGLETT